ncbi:MAG TPA: hypothetical protein VFZ92_09985 [Umezawaea sp.]
MRMLPALVLVEIPSGQNSLYHDEGFIIDEALVLTGVLHARVSNHPDVVRVAQDALHVLNLEERYIIGQTRGIERTLLSRVVRATAPGFRVFPYSFDEDPESPIKNIRIGVEAPARVARVLRHARNSYVFHIELPEALQEGERASFRFYITADGSTFEDVGMVLKQQMVHTERVLLSVEFRANEHPERVWWLESPYPIMTATHPDFPFNENKRLPRLPTDIYEMEFTKPMRPARLVGIAWQFGE